MGRLMKTSEKFTAYLPWATPALPFALALTLSLSLSLTPALSLALSRPRSLPATRRSSAASLATLPQLDPRSGYESQRTFGDNGLAGLQTAFDHRLFTGALADSYRTNLHRLVRFHNVYI